MFKMIWEIKSIFSHDEKGTYLSSPFSALSDRSYQLVVQVEEAVYTSSGQTITH